MNSLNSMIQKLKSIGIYSLSGKTLVDAELKAYAVGFDLINKKLEELKREIFIKTAESYGLSNREKVFGTEKKELPLKARRDMLLYRNAVTVNNTTRKDIERALIACGIQSSICEKISEQKLYINCISILKFFRSYDEIKERASEFLPAHLSYEFDFSPLSWDAIDNKDCNFNQFDDFDLNWNQIDSYQ